MHIIRQNHHFNRVLFYIKRDWFLCAAKNSRLHASAVENNKPSFRKQSEVYLGFKSPITSKYFGNLSLKPFSDKSQQKILNTTSTIKHPTKPTKMNPFSSVKSETVISKQLLWPFRSYI